MDNEEAKVDTKPRTIDEAFAVMSDIEAKALEDDTFTQAEELGAPPKKEDGEKKPSPLEEVGSKPIPDFVTFPSGFRVPPGKEVIVMVFRAKWTDRPERGDRWCLLWSLSDADEKLALKRTRGESARSIGELAKQSIRLIDGKRADWTKTLAEGYDVDRFWDEIGAKCRQRVVDFYLKMHSLKAEELTDFFENCLFVRKAGG